MNLIKELEASGLNPIVIDEDTDFETMSLPMTNIDFVTDLMTYNPAGALCQPFIIEAISRYAKEVMVAEPWPDDVMISFEAWRACAEHINKKIENRK